jgi:preprotein translocase subunit SecE
MNREMRRLMEREERRQKKKEAAGAKSRRAPAAGRAPAGERAGAWRRLLGFLHDVRVELRKVSWPTREQMVAFTTVTLITTVALTLLIFGLDVVLKEVVLFMIGGAGG